MNETTRRISIGCAVLVALGIGELRAEVKPNALISEGAVLQQKIKVPIWGTAKDGEKVTVEFQKQKVTTIATNGQWKVVLKPLRVGGPYTLKITGDASTTSTGSVQAGSAQGNTLVYTNILVGEVWICSGQSNMQWGLGSCENAADAIARASDPMLRLFTVPNTAADAPQSNVGGNWYESATNTVGGFSGVAYYFGRDLRRSLNVPVGLIHTSWGGSPAETWVPRETLLAEPMLKNVVEGHEQRVKAYLVQLEQYKQAEPELKKKYDEEVVKAKAEGKQPPPAPAPPADPGAHPHRPSALYNAMIAPLEPFAIRGAIWYQGESNAGRAYEYRTLFATMIQSWRKMWGQGDFPFLFVQLAPYGNAAYGNSVWAELREAQSLTARNVPKTGMAVITDAGDCRDIHPRRKEPVGARLALAARGIAYGQGIEYFGPQYHSMKIKGDQVTLTFTHVGGGLVAKDGELKGFTIAGADQKFVSAKAEIKGSRVIVWSDEVKQPVAVRYGWADCPSVNLFNKKDLPASPFRTDDFPMVTKPK